MSESENQDIESIDQFGQLLFAWHNNRVQQLRAIKDAPDDVEIQFQSDTDGPADAVMTPEQRKGFRAGIIVALSLVENLPFTMTVAEEEPEQEPTYVN